VFHPGFGAAAMRTGIAVLAAIVLSANATAAQTQYAVDGLAIGTKLNFDSASYREYKCSPSDQFGGLIWCQKTRADKERRGSYTAAYSILHSREGNVLYVNRSQEPAFFKRTEAQDDIQRYSRSIGESPRIMKMPHRSGIADGLIAIWGKITLEQLDQESLKILADGKSPKKGLLIDFIGNFVRSAKEGLPIYRIDGGPGFIWGASFDRKGRGTLRLAAVDASGFLSPPREEQPPPQPIADRTETNETRPELGQTIEKLQTEMASVTMKIAELEKAKGTAEAARIEAAKASVGVETAKREIAQAIVTEKANLEAAIAQLEADRVAANAATSRWENALYGAFGGLFVVLTAFTAVFFINRRNDNISKDQVYEPETNPIDVSGQAQHSEAQIISHTLSPELATAEAALQRELEKQVAAINATQDRADGQNQLAGTRSNRRSDDADLVAVREELGVRSI
jgi:cell division septum initiation protein DivIVA